MRNPFRQIALSILLAAGCVGIVFAQDDASNTFPELYNSEKEAGEPLDALAALGKMKLPE